MARPLRIEYPGAFYHVTSRGNAKGDIYLSRGDRFKFLSYLNTAVEQYGLLIHAYCLMGNHYHLMAETPRGNLSQIMQHVNSAYTLSFNLRNDRVGHLFQGRYKAILIDSEAYALEISRYIHLNPARAGIVGNPFAYRWSSLGTYTGRRVAPDWLKTDYVLSFFRGPGSRKKSAYRQFVAEGLRGRKKNPFEDVTGSYILGRDGFIEMIKEQYLSTTKISPDIAGSEKLREMPSIPAIVNTVQSVFKKNPKAGRQAAIHFCCRYSGARRREIGAHFRITGAAVSQGSRRFEERLKQDPGLREASTRIIKILKC